MPLLSTLTDAGGRTVADHAERLQRTLDGFTARLRDAVATAVGDAVAGAVQAAVRAALDDLAGRPPPATPFTPPRSEGPSYWDDDDPYHRTAWPGRHAWGHDHDHNHGYGTEPPCDRSPEDRTARERPARRWLPALVVAGRLLARWLTQQPRPPRWLAALGAGTCMALAAATGLAGPGWVQPALGLAALTGSVRSGSALLHTLLS